jgi:hypothetical protein
MKLSPRQREALGLIADGRFFPDFAKEDDGWHARWRAVGSDNGWVDEYVRQSAMTPLTEDAENERHETLHDAWMMALKSRTGLVVWDERECEEFAAEIREWNGAAEEDVAARNNIVFRFCAPAGDGGFSLRLEIPEGRRALRALGMSMFVFPPLRALRRDGGELCVSLERAEAEAFAAHGARELAEAGYRVEGADLSAPLAVEAELRAPENKSPKPTKMELSVTVAGEKVSAAEIRFLLDQGSSLVFFRDRWIEVDRNLLKQALRALERGGRDVSSPLGFALGIGRIGELEIENIKVHGWLRGLVHELRSAGKMPRPGSGEIPGLNGELRDYQRRGVEWLRFLTDHGFGALLADDMGLGKTVQVIAWMLSRRAAGKGANPVLIVAPLTLLVNWEREFARFAPSLKVHVHHGDSRFSGSYFGRTARAADAVVTSYNLLVRDYESFSAVKWDALVLDEAQTVKNPDTRAARAIRALLPPQRIALTGTPVENSVMDVWALEDFLNPGFLGERKPFERRFARPIAENGQCAAAARLRRALEPFVLRRLKSDASVAAELGDKREIREYCRLGADERRRYEAALEDFRTSERRRGDVFALITELKLICDGESKFERLCGILETVFENGESALVFTQYAKVGARLKAELEKRFAKRFHFLHGALSLAAREREIAAFNRGGPGAFILSLKAGGFGLNLTKATHVIHFDRWWNPAAESQATDRAHRIGQRKEVFVHLMITAGTLEEHVDDILRGKTRMADSLITESEWLEAAKLDE